MWYGNPHPSLICMGNILPIFNGSACNARAVDCEFDVTPLPKHLEEMRDELAEKQAERITSSLVDADTRSRHFRNGFNQAASILLKDMESMAKALESQRCELLQSYKVNLKNHDCKRCEALKIWREKYATSKAEGSGD